MIARGCVIGMRAGLVEVRLPNAAVGAPVRIEAAPVALGGIVRAVARDCAYVAVHGSGEGVAVGVPVRAGARCDALALGACALGRSIDATGNPLDGGPPLRGRSVALRAPAPLPDERRAIESPMWTGVKAIDALLTLGRGARIGIFGAPGAGKSTLLESIVRGNSSDAIVIGLIGERGREAQAWIARCDERTTIVCATSDRPAAERVRAASVTMAHARALAARGLDVLVVVDSLARYAAALREIAVAAGESTGRGGYPPSVFAAVAELVEQCGASARGSLTLIATVLSDGDDRDPVSESARALLDGHIALSQPLAQAGRFPAIDILASASRTMDQVVSLRHRADARSVRGAVAVLERTADARSLGIESLDPATLAALAVEERIECLLRQGRAPEAPSESLAMLAEIADTLGAAHGHSD